MALNFKRILNFAVNDFSRNRGISISAIFVLAITIMLATGLFFFQGIAGYLTSQIKDKIDITAYFVNGTTEQDILGVKDQILKMSPNIKNVEYISADQALASFNENHKDSAVLIKALSEVGDNPFQASLNITTDGEPSQYASVSNILQTSDFSKLIAKVSFPKATIEKVYSITSNVNLFGLILGILLTIIAVSVVFNTIRLIVENSKDEISTMKIVGASDWFIRGPFVIQGVIYGIVAFIICFILSGIFAYFLSSSVEIMLPGFSIFSYFLTNWFIFVLIQLGFGVGLGAISALIAVRKHLDL